jgi:hypothetical protein
VENANADLTSQAWQPTMALWWLNPYSPLSEKEMYAVALNEATRVVMATHGDLRPSFAPTPEQEAAFANYGPPEFIKATVAARILSGDPSALIPTAEQIAFVLRLAREMGIPTDALRLGKVPKVIE